MIKATRKDEEEEEEEDSKQERVQQWTDSEFVAGRTLLVA